MVLFRVTATLKYPFTSRGQTCGPNEHKREENTVLGGLEWVEGGVFREMTPPSFFFFLTNA
jgi:hypothetical protein